MTLFQQTEQTELPDMSGDWYLMWDMTGREGKPIGKPSKQPIPRTVYDRALITTNKIKYEKLRTLTNRDYHEFSRGTATLVDGALVHHATNLIEA